MRKSSNNGHVIGVPVTSKAYGIEEVSSRDPSFRKQGDASDHLAVSLTHPSPYTSLGYKHGSKGQVIHWVSKLGRRAQGFREHVTLGPKLSETVKGKLSLGARILQAGGVERVFRQAFAADKGERLVKALQCYIYTTGGPIAGMLFVSTKKVAFRSDRPHHRHLPRRRHHGAGHLQGGRPAPEDRQGAAERERRPAGREVHPRRHRRRLRVLVHGIRQLPALLQVHAAGRLGAAAACMTAPACRLMRRRSGRSGG